MHGDEEGSNEDAIDIDDITTTEFNIEVKETVQWWVGRWDSVKVGREVRQCEGG